MLNKSINIKWNIFFRIESDTSSDGDDVLPDNTLDVERSVHASAIKNNLDETSVKKILKVSMVLIYFFTKILLKLTDAKLFGKKNYFLFVSFCHFFL